MEKRSLLGMGCCFLFTLFVQVFPYVFGVNALLNGEWVVRDSYDYGTGEILYRFTGWDARRIGIGWLAAGVCCTLWSMVVSFLPEWRKKAAVHWCSFVFILLAILFWFAPWRIGIDRGPTVVYLFLGLSGTTWSLLRASSVEGRARRAAGVALGLAGAAGVAVIVGGSEVIYLLVIGVFLVFALGGHLRLLFPSYASFPEAQQQGKSSQDAT